MVDIKNLNIIKNQLKPSRKKDKRSLIFFLNIKFVLVFIIFSILMLLLWSNPTSNSVFKKVLGQNNNLEVTDDRVNILLLGMAGGNHEGATLTDTIIVASLNTKTNEVDLISLPRDLWIESQNSKINALYQKGQKDEGGLFFAEGKISEVLGIKIPYGVRMDFSGFIKAIDLVGGLEINIQKNFDDYLYPVAGKEKDYCGLEEKDMEVPDDQAKTIGVEPGKHQVLVDASGKIATASAKVGEKIEYTEDNIGKTFPCRYEHLSFVSGLTKMDGETALKFVRSRHGTNGEGSDFARSRRQQKVLQAFKDKVLSLETLTDISKIISLIKTFGESVESDIPQTAYPELISLVKKTSASRSTVFSSEGQHPLLFVPPVGKYSAWVLIPENNDFSYIQKYIQDVFAGSDTATKSATVEN